MQSTVVRKFLRNYKFKWSERKRKLRPNSLGFIPQTVTEAGPVDSVDELQFSRTLTSHLTIIAVEWRLLGRK